MMKFKLNAFLLGGILMMAVLLRFVGIRPGYPPIHADEGITHSQGLAMILERSLNPKHGYGLPYNYPIVVPLVNAFFYLFFLIPVSLLLRIGRVASMIGESGWIEFGQKGIYDLFENDIFGAGWINVVYWGRYVTALFGVGVVVLTYKLARQMFDEKVALVSSFLAAINYRMVLNSHFGLPDIYNSFFLLLSLWLIFRLWESQSLKNYLLAGAGVAVFFSTKFQIYSGFALGAVLAFLFFRRKSSVKYLLGLIGVMAGLVLVLNIFHIVHWQETVAQVHDSALKYKIGQNRLDPYSYYYLYRIGLGEAAAILVLVGMGLMVVKETWRAMFLLVVIAPFFWMMTYYSGGGFYTRNFVTVIPILLIFAGQGVVYLGEKRFLVTVALLGVVACQSLGNSLVVPAAYSRPWNRSALGEWVEENIGDGSVVLTDKITELPEGRLRVRRAEKSSDYFMAEMRERGVEWVVINTDWINRSYYWWMGPGGVLGFGNLRRPDGILENTLVAKMMEELGSYVVFEELNPWQAPDTNYLVVRIPERAVMGSGELAYHEEFGAGERWIAENDGFGEMENFVWRHGALGIIDGGGGYYSQRFRSGKIGIDGGGVYKVVGKMRAEKNLSWEERDGILGVNFYSGDDLFLTSALASRLSGSSEWQEKEIVVEAPGDAKYLEIFFQVDGFYKSSFWLDEVWVWRGERLAGGGETEYIDSKFNLGEHLFPYSHGGM